MQKLIYNAGHRAPSSYVPNVKIIFKSNFFSIPDFPLALTVIVGSGIFLFVLVASVAFISGHSRKVRSSNVQPEVDLRPANTNCSDLADQVLFQTFCSARWSAFLFLSKK